MIVTLPAAEDATIAVDTASIYKIAIKTIVDKDIEYKFVLYKLENPSTWGEIRRLAEDTYLSFENAVGSKNVAGIAIDDDSIAYILYEE